MPKSKMRILHVYRRFRPDFTGDGIYFEKLFKHFVDLGIEQDVLVYETPRGKVTDWRSVEHRGTHGVVYLAPPEAHPTTRQLCAWLWRHRARYDLIHVHTHGNRNFVFYILARMLGIAVLYSSTLEDSAPQLVAGYRPSLRWLARRLLRSFNAMVAISPSLFEGNLSHLPAHRATFIPQGVAPAPLPNARERAALRGKLGIGPDDIALLFVGSISVRKDPAFLIRNLAKIREAAPNVKLVLVGPTTEQDYADRLRRLIGELGMGEHVKWFGETDSPGDYYAAADIFVFASRSEGFGNVLLEAMSFGLPVVSRWLDGVTDYFICSGENGYLFRDDDEYCRAVVDLARDARLRAALGNSGLAGSRREFDLRRIAQEYVRLYRLWTEPRPRTAAPVIFHPFAIRGCEHVANGPEFLGMERVPAASAEPPTLHVVIDTESEFDWNKGTADDHGNVKSIQRLERIQNLCEKVGAIPCYVVDYPVASSRESIAVVREMLRRGAEIGAHLQPWTTPPAGETIDGWHAFPGNLSPYLERLKLETLKATIRDNFGIDPKVYKAGRYGIGRTSLGLIEDLGFEVDLSVTPKFDYSPEGGPNYMRFDAHPRSFGHFARLLELPTTAGFIGWARGRDDRLWTASERRLFRPLHVRGILDRLEALQRVRLSPEAYDLAKMCALTTALHGDGVRHFTVSLHSSSLLPGNTPYARSEEDVDRLLDCLGDYLNWFATAFGGRMSSPLATKRRLMPAPVSALSA